MNELDYLKQILPPPTAPLELPSDAIWAECESELIRMPTDFKEFLESYGTGAIDGFLWIFNPASKNPNLNLVLQVKRQLSALSHLLREKAESRVYAVFPEDGGLLPFGITDNGDVLFWRTLGSPENWSVVVGESRAPEYNEYKRTMTGFLTSILSKQEVVPVFPQDFPNSPPLFELPEERT
jgi:hypothetical protein